MNDQRHNPERSVVSILVADMVGSTDRVADLDPDEAAELFDRVYQHFSAAVEAEGGSFVSYAGDGGVAVFGWPNSQEDHADRACMAAWNIQQKVIRAGGLRQDDIDNVHFRVGVHSGLVGLRQISLQFGKMLDTVGGTVHLAATIEKHTTPGEVQISTATARLCRCELAVKPGAEIPALKKTGADALWLTAKPAPPPGLARSINRPVVGRADERAALKSAVLGARDGFSTVGLIGEPGIGKSRLATSTIDDAIAALPDIKLAVFNGDARLGSTPFACARSLTAGVVERLEQPDSADAAELLATLEITPEFPGAAETIFGQIDDLGSAGPTSVEVGRTFARIVEKVSQRHPVMLIVEDLHLLDPESAICLEMLATEPSSSKGIMLLTSRPEGRTTLNRIATDVREVLPMTADDLQSLAEAFPEIGGLNSQHLALAIERSGGVPFILEQLLLAGDVSALQRPDALPETVQSLIHARLNRLDPSTKQTAQILSIMGERVDMMLAQEVLALSSTELMEQMAELDSLSLIRSAPGAEIRFAHAIVADACGVTVPRSWKREIHAKALKAIRLVYPDPTAHLERLAYHAEEATEYAEALEYLWSAAKHARRNGADESLNLICMRANRCADHLDQSESERYGDIVLLASPSMLQLGFFDGMDRQLARTMEIARAQGRHDKICGAQCHLGMLRWFRAEYEAGREVTEAALHTARAIGAMPLVFSAQIIHAFCLHALGQVDEAIETQREICEMLGGELELSRLGTSWIPASIAHSFLAWFLMDKGEYEEALEKANRAHDIAVRAEDVYSRIMGLHAIGRGSLLLGQHQASADVLTTATELITQHGYETVRPHVTGHLSMALSRIGRAEEAVGLARPLTNAETADRTGTQEMFQLYSGLGEALFESGAHDEAWSWIDRAVVMAENAGNQCLLVQAYALRARVLLHSDPESKAAAEDLRRQAEICKAFGIVAPPWGWS